MNIYWPVYKNLERELNKLMFSIHIDDRQLGVYSSLISDLIIRASVEIESISKELYKLNGGSKTTHIYYDDDALKYLNKIWTLESKVVYLISSNCYLSNRDFFPFRKNEKSTLRNKDTYSWNNSYQNLKHDKFNSLEFGSVKYLLDAMAALFVLNLYFKSDFFNLGKDPTAINFPISLGSEIFAINLSFLNYGGKGEILKKEDFEKGIYVVKRNKESGAKFDKAINDFTNKANELIFSHPKMLDAIQNNTTLQKLSFFTVLGKEEVTRLLNRAALLHPNNIQDIIYEAEINKNQF